MLNAQGNAYVYQEEFAPIELRLPDLKYRPQLRPEKAGCEFLEIPMQESSTGIELLRASRFDWQRVDAPPPLHSVNLTALPDELCKNLAQPLCIASYFRLNVRSHFASQVKVFHSVSK